MADKENSFLSDMVGKKGRPAKPAVASEPISNRVNPKTVVSNPYDVQSYGILKMRLSEQNTQVQDMTDYSEDSAIKLNDIYEILQQLKPNSSVSSLDSYFNENGYIPVKVLNPCCEGDLVDNNGSGLGLSDLGGALAFAKWLWPALRAFAVPLIAEMILGGGANIHENGGDERLAARREAEALAAKKDFDDAAKIMSEHFKKYGEGPIASDEDTAEYWRKKYLNDKGATGLINQIDAKGVQRKSDNELSGIGNRDRQDRNSSYENDIKSLTDQIHEKLKLPRQTSEVFSNKNTSTIFSSKETGNTSNTPLTLASYGITKKDNSDNTTMSARKINFIAKEITYDADKFEFINKSTITAPTNTIGGNGTELASFNPNGDITTPGADYNMSNSSVATGDLKSNQAEAYKAAIAGGLNDTAARALVANMSGEALSTPGDVHWDGSHYAHGIVQWDDNRAEKIKQHFGKYPQDMTVAEQTKAALWEIQTDYPGLWESMKTGDAASIVSDLVSQYERPADTYTATQQRLNFLNGLPDDLGVTNNTAQNSKGPHNDIFELSASTATTLNMPQQTTAGATNISYNPRGGVQSPMERSFNEPLTATIEDMFDKLLNDTLMYTV